ncbi:alpha-(1-_3)-arabinofuranosyltransferase domain-containing protein [Streptomyces platensis]|uniref:alpha-(1->3)-arabinofuranosyltransferase domain-containing protein n=1 Tax=Streptomyces platensis TaxID=58346 RepID=UPI003C2AF22F
MTQTLRPYPSPGSPDGGGRPTPAPAPPPGLPRRRRWLFAFWALALAGFLAPSPGKMTFETKLGVTTDPWRFLADLGQLWHDRAGLGGIADQYIGYAFPTLPYYGLADLVQVPVWLAERLWMSLIVTAAFWGALRLAERLRVGTPPARLLAAACYALWPTFTLVIGSTSAAALPGALLPWVLLPLTNTQVSARIAATRSALLIPFMGGVNAASTLAALLPAGLYLLSRTGPRRPKLLAWWLPGVVLATAWWVVPLLLLGLHGENFMPYIEQADTTTGTMSATELLRGAGNWVGYLHFGEPWLPAGWTLTAQPLAVLGSALAAALGLAGLARRDLPERRWLLLTVLAVALIALAGYGGALGGPLHGLWQDWLNGWLRPFRNIYKFTPGLALALALGLAHLLAVATERRGTRRIPARGRLPLVTALLVLPALTLPFLTGTVLQPGAFTELPASWRQAAAWLHQHSPHSRALVVPATAHGIYTWGSPIDEPLDVLATSPWAQRDFVPFGTPGARRTLDAVEQALLTGAQVPGLRDYLGRAGLHDVVVRNDLDPDQIGYVPPQTVKRTLQASGYRKVAAFGPLTTGGRIPSGAPLQVQGLYPRQRAVEIYRPRDTPRPGPVTTRAVADTAQLSGGPEALLQLSADPALRRRATVLTGDRHPGLGTPPLQLTADGLRRADTRFGLVNSNTSYTYTADERNHPDSVQDPGRPPRQILPTTGPGHQTTAVLRGATSVTASSSGNWLFQLPQYDPVHAFDGDPDTAWAEGSAGNPVGQWVRIAFPRPITLPSALSLTPLPGDGLRAAPTSVRVQTDRGTTEDTLRPDGTPQRVKAPAGRASWLKVTVLGSQTPRAGLSGAGFREISVPGVQVTRLLRLPADAERSGAPAEVVSLHRGSNPGGLSPASAEAGLHRQFHTGPAAAYRVSAQALAVPGPELDRLLDRIAPEQRDRITATADSTAFGFGPSLSPRNLVDGDLTTAWIAGDRPTVHLRWPGRKKIDQIVLAAAGGLATRPEQILINSPYGAATAGVDENGQARFDPLTTDRLDITISKVKPLTLHNPVVGQALQLPVGIGEIHLPALDAYRTPRPAADARFSLGCGQGPMLAVDGVLHATQATGHVRDLTERRPVEVRLCAGPARDGSLDLPSGRHRVEAGDQGPLALTDVTLRRGAAGRTGAGGLGEEREAGASGEGTGRETAAASEGTGTASAASGVGPEQETASGDRPGRETAGVGAARESAAPVRKVAAEDWSGDRRSVAVGAGRAVYLQMHENANDGWQATLHGRRLTPLRVDGWQQAFLVPAGAGGTVELSYTPAVAYDLGLAGGALGVVVLLLSALVRRTPRTPPPLTAPPPAPSWVLGVVALTAVLALAAGPYALIVPALALLAYFRPPLLVPLSLAAMVSAGAVAALGAGEPHAAGKGAFSAPAQALALLALAAAVVTVRGRAPREPVFVEGAGMDAGGPDAGAPGAGGPLTGGPLTGGPLTGGPSDGTSSGPSAPSAPSGPTAPYGPSGRPGPEEPPGPSGPSGRVDPPGQHALPPLPRRMRDEGGGPVAVGRPIVARGRTPGAGPNWAERHRPRPDGPVLPVESGPVRPGENGAARPSGSGPETPPDTGPVRPTGSRPVPPAGNGPARPTNSRPVPPTGNGPAPPTSSGPARSTNRSPVPPPGTGPKRPTSSGPLPPPGSTPARPTNDSGEGTTR